MSTLLNVVGIIIVLALVCTLIYLLMKDGPAPTVTSMPSMMSGSGTTVAQLLNSRAPMASSTSATSGCAAVEGFADQASADASTVGTGSMPSRVLNSEDPVGMNELQRRVMENQSAMVDGVSAGMTQLPSECYPKDVLTSSELLPRDANLLYAQVNPSSQGSLQDQNFLTAGFHIGINTVGQTLRNANRQVRSEPPNPQVKVSPWMQTTIEPDINRLPLEIGGCP